MNVRCEIYRAWLCERTFLSFYTTHGSFFAPRKEILLTEDILIYYLKFVSTE